MHVGLPGAFFVQCFRNQIPNTGSQWFSVHMRRKLLAFVIYSLLKRTLLERKRGHVEFKRVVELCIQAFIARILRLQE